MTPIQKNVENCQGFVEESGRAERGSCTANHFTPRQSPPQFSRPTTCIGKRVFWHSKRGEVIWGADSGMSCVGRSDFSAPLCRCSCMT
ncbi:hypothetical protein CEXT_282531 [Caerostris extrusa]|uniref:Uncharacterized protein n=1 Tax=Caerostris extrusa TaxID=172846 RepID=A0AAV4WFN8_CAEEX|nr:hypothetical protein CEXT_282531 [Caerostris extrusa]